MGKRKPTWDELPGSPCPYCGIPSKVWITVGDRSGCSNCVKPPSAAVQAGIGRVLQGLYAKLAERGINGPEYARANPEDFYLVYCRYLGDERSDAEIRDAWRKHAEKRQQ